MYLLFLYLLCFFNCHHYFCVHGTGSDIGSTSEITAHASTDSETEPKSELNAHSGIVSQRLIVASNAPPFKLKFTDKHEWQIEQGSGGLIACVEPIMKQNEENIWFFSHSIDSKWEGGLAKMRQKYYKKSLRKYLDNYHENNYNLKAVFISPSIYKRFYAGISNGLIWPAFHDCPDFIVPGLRGPENKRQIKKQWKDYRAVNRKFAEEMMKNSRSGDILFIQDYQLIMVGLEVQNELKKRKISEQKYTNRLFLHIPFQPSDELFAENESIGKSILEGILAYDKVGFQTSRDLKRFLELVERDLPESVCKEKTFNGQKVSVVSRNGKKCHLGVFPVSIKHEEFLKLANGEEAKERAKKIRTELFGANKCLEKNECHLFFSAERFDYTKGIKEKLEAFEHYLDVFPDRRGKDILFQVAIKNRSEIPTYEKYQTMCLKIVNEINAKFVDEHPGWTPVILNMKGFEPDELIAHYLAMDIGVVTPVMDGMNLVAKEMMVTNPSAGLILSHGAGAHIRLTDAGLNANYHHVKNIEDAAAFAQVFHKAAKEELDTRALHGNALRKFIMANDIHKWGQNFLNSNWPSPDGEIEN